MKTASKIFFLFFLLNQISFASTCTQIEELGYPVTGTCNVSAGEILNLEAEKKIIKGSVCWGNYGSVEDGQNAVSFSFETDEGETLSYVWEMPSGRANRTNLNDYTYFGKWKRGIFFEDQTTIDDDTTFFKPILSQGVVIDYKKKEVEIIKTYKKFWGKAKVIYDAYLKCGSLNP